MEACLVWWHKKNTFRRTLSTLSCKHQTLLKITLVLSHLFLPVVRSARWYQGSLVCLVSLALPEVQGGLSYLAPLVVQELFGQRPQTVRGFGSVWSCNETSGLWAEKVENGLIINVSISQYIFVCCLFIVNDILPETEAIIETVNPAEVRKENNFYKNNLPLIKLVLMWKRH